MECCHQQLSVNPISAIYYTINTHRVVIKVLTGINRRFVYLMTEHNSVSFILYQFVKVNHHIFMLNMFE